MMKMNIFWLDPPKSELKILEIHQNQWKSSNHLNFETMQLRDADEFGNFETCYDYLLPELRPFPGSIRRGNRGSRLEIARESAFENGLADPAMCTDLP